MEHALFWFFRPIGLIPQGFVEMPGPYLGMELDFPSAQFPDSLLHPPDQFRSHTGFPQGFFDSHPPQDLGSWFWAWEEPADPYRLASIIPQEAMMGRAVGFIEFLLETLFPAEHLFPQSPCFLRQLFVSRKTHVVSSFCKSTGVLHVIRATPL